MLERISMVAVVVATILGADLGRASAQTDMPVLLDLSAPRDDAAERTTRQDRANRLYVIATALTVVGGGIAGGALLHGVLREPETCYNPGCGAGYTAVIGSLMAGGALVAGHGLALFIPAIVLDLSEGPSGEPSGSVSLELTGRF